MLVVTSESQRLDDILDNMFNMPWYQIPFDGIVQDCSNSTESSHLTDSSVLAVELFKFCTEHFLFPLLT